MNISSRLIELRKGLKLTQNQVAQVLSCDRSTYAYYENGKTKPSYASLYKLSKLYNISIDALLGNNTDTKNYILHDDSDDFGYTISDVINNFQTLSRQEQLLILLFRSSSDKQGIINNIKQINLSNGEKSI